MAFQHRWSNNISRLVPRHARIQKFSSGGSRSICHNLTTFLLVLFSSTPLILQNANCFFFKGNYNFPRFQRGSNIFSRRGGPTISRGGGGGGGGGGLVPLPPPLDQCMQYFAVTKVRYEKKLSILTPRPLGIPTCIHGVWKNNHSGLGSKLFLNFWMGAQW